MMFHRAFLFYKWNINTVWVTAVQKFLATSHKPIKIQYFKMEKSTTANMQIFFHNSIDFFH